MAFRPPALVDLTPGNLGLEFGVPRSSSVSVGSSVFVEIPDCDTSLYVDGPSITFPQTPGMWGCIVPTMGIPHPDAMVRFDGITGAASGSTVTVDSANDPGKTMVVAGTPSFQQTIGGWTKRAMTLPQTTQTGLRVPLDLDGSWFDVGRQDVAALCWFGASSSGGNRTFLSLAGLSIQLRITAAGKLSLFTTGGDTVGTFDYRHAGTLTIHPFLVGLKRSTQQIKVWTDKEVLTGVWTYAGDAEKGLYAAGQTPPVSAWLGFDLWKGSKATTIFDLGDTVLRRLNWAMAY